MMKIKKSGIVFISLFFLCSALIGAMLGWTLSETQNIKNTEYITSFDTALPTKLLDINGELITEFSSDEKREIIAYNKLPQEMIDALITREDRIFFSHKGFSFKALVRAAVGVATRRSLGGGSTLTQQIAGTLYCDRNDKSVVRKIKELWWAIQMERRYSKNEILELYLNKIYFGGGTYGVNAASKYYFGHDATQLNAAESAILVIQLSNPAKFNPFDHPDVAMERQRSVLQSMVNAGYISQLSADQSFDDYWANFDFTRTSSSAYLIRDDKAPWFSEYIRRELSGMIYGSDDIYTSGFTVNTTVNLAHQLVAQDVMERYIATANKRYQAENASKSNIAYNTYVPLTELLALTFGIPELKVSEERAKIVATSEYVNTINPVLDMISLLCGSDKLKINIVNRATSLSKEQSERTTIEGTMVALNHENGYIDAMVGGSKYASDNQFIRATQAKIQPGSTFKPLYYSAAIDSRKFTPTTVISDTPVVFHTSDGKPYIPANFRGEWAGNVPLWYALIHSMNVPSLKVLDGIGFSAALDRAVALLGIPQDELASRAFDPGYALGLGVGSVRPIELARAYGIFANGGKEITPFGIRTVEDKNGNVIENPELEIRQKQAKKGDAIQVISPQTAFVMTKLLEQTVFNGGTLAYQSRMVKYKDENGKTYTMPVGGKTGTTQNWADALTCGISPYYSAAFWFGFDRPGQSLGLNITGSTLAGFAWGEYFGKIHEDLPYKDWEKPATGVVKLTVCSESGMLLTDECGDHQTTQWYLEGTQPTEFCTVHSNSSISTLARMRLEREMYKSGERYSYTIDTSPLVVNFEDFNGTTSSTSDSDNYVTETGKKNGKQNNKQNTVQQDYDYNYLME
ncbi:MAG: PBP1A family penicillin-binding protein [Spirochaetales bacterium]|nr:PBP1A family penicillin-binding protein [Spirochaetales bacterium]